MSRSLWWRGTARLLVALLVVTQGGANVHQWSVDHDVTTAGASDQPAADISSASPVLQHPPEQDTDNYSVIVTRLLKELGEERDRAIQAATAPLLATQTRQQEKLDSVAGEMSEQRSQQADVTVRMTALEGRQDSLEGRLDSISQRLDDIQFSFEQSLFEQSSFEQWLEPLAAGLQSRLDAMDERLHSVESRQNATESSQTDPDDSPLDQQSKPDADLPRDCSDLLAESLSGIYMLQPGLARPQPPVSAYCDMETDGGGWTVFQRRADINPRQDFFLDWTAYKEGFGDQEGEFWWGLQSLWTLTSAPDRRYELRVDLHDFDGDHLHAAYRDFGVSFETDGYRLLGGNFTGGDAGDSLTSHFGHRFSTKDRDQDTGTSHCARTRRGGWWYHACHDANLNGPYLAGRTPKDVYGVNWPTWRGWRYSLKRVEMKIRPRTESG